MVQNIAGFQRTMFNADAEILTVNELTKYKNSSRFYSQLPCLQKTP